MRSWICIVTSPRLVSLHLTSPCLTSRHLTSPHLTSPHHASPRLTSPHLTSPHLASPHLTTPHLTSPHLTSPHLTSPHLASPLTFTLTSPVALAVIWSAWGSWGSCAGVCGVRNTSSTRQCQRVGVAVATTRCTGAAQRSKPCPFTACPCKMSQTILDRMPIGRLYVAKKYSLFSVIVVAA